MDTFSSNSFTLKEEIFNKILERENLQMKREDEIRASITTVKSKEIENYSRLDNNKEQLDKVIFDIRVLDQIVANLKTETNNLKDLKLDSSEFLQIKEYIMDDVNNIKLSIENTRVSLRETDNYIRVFKPLNEFKQVANMFDYVISDKDERERLVEYVK